MGSALGSNGSTRRWRTIRARTVRRDRRMCQICGVVTLRGEVDHVQPRHLGGHRPPSTIFRYLCKSCHKARRGIPRAEFHVEGRWTRRCCPADTSPEQHPHAARRHDPEVRRWWLNAPASPRKPTAATSPRASGRPCRHGRCSRTTRPPPRASARAHALAASRGPLHHGRLGQALALPRGRHRRGPPERQDHADRAAHPHGPARGERILHTAQNRELPRKSFLALVGMINAQPDLGGWFIRRGNGQEEITHADGRPLQARRAQRRQPRRDGRPRHHRRGPRAARLGAHGRHAAHDHGAARRPGASTCPTPATRRASSSTTPARRGPRATRSSSPTSSGAPTPSAPSTTARAGPRPTPPSARPSAGTRSSTSTATGPRPASRPRTCAAGWTRCCRAWSTRPPGRRRARRCRRARAPGHGHRPGPRGAARQRGHRLAVRRGRHVHVLADVTGYPVDLERFAEQTNRAGPPAGHPRDRLRPLDRRATWRATSRTPSPSTSPSWRPPATASRARSRPASCATTTRTAPRAPTSP